MLRNAAQGGLLVVIALALFLDFSLAFWVVVGLPFAVLGCLATMEILGLPVSINVLSVFGFILVLGLLVDDAIVTAESAYARLERDRDGLRKRGRRRAARHDRHGVRCADHGRSLRAQPVPDRGFCAHPVAAGLRGDPVRDLLVDRDQAGPACAPAPYPGATRSGDKVGSGAGCSSAWPGLLRFAQGPYRRALAVAVHLPLHDHCDLCSPA
jgi:hypothetical protein